MDNKVLISKEDFEEAVSRLLDKPVEDLNLNYLDRQLINNLLRLVQNERKETTI